MDMNCFFIMLQLVQFLSQPKVNTLDQRIEDGSHGTIKSKKTISQGLINAAERRQLQVLASFFQLTDIAERMSDSISETQEIAVDFIYKIKLKVVKYLLKCVKRLLEFEIDENDLLLKDLHRRMLRWRHQGKDVFHGYKDLDDAIDVIASKLSHSSL